VRSQNHHMFGSIGQWLLEDLAGIEPRRPGCAEIEFRPEIPAQGLGAVEAWSGGASSIGSGSYRFRVRAAAG